VSWSLWWYAANYEKNVAVFFLSVVLFSDLAESVGVVYQSW